MEKVLVDTDVLSEYLKGYDPKVVRAGDTYAETHLRFTVSVVTVYEVALGLRIKRASAQLSRALNWFESNEVIAATERDFLDAAELKANARLAGKIVELPDCLIALAASRLGLPLVTGNTDDFVAIRESGLSQLRLQNWRTL